MNKETFEFGQVELTTKYKSITYTDGSTADLKHKGEIYASYTVEGVEHKTLVAKFRNDNRSGGNKRTYVTLYMTSGVTDRDIEPALYELITKKHTEARNDYIEDTEAGKTPRLNRALYWLVCSVRHLRYKKSIETQTNNTTE